MFKKLSIHLTVIAIIIISGQDCFSYKFERDSLKKSYKSGFDIRFISENDDNNFSTIQNQIRKDRAGKSKTNAMLIAVIPGSVIHGLGHLYVGRPVGFAALFAAEAGSIALIAYYGFGEGSNNTRNKSEMLAWGGFGIFMTTWIYDIFESGRIAERKHLNSYALTFRPYRYNGKIIPSLKLTASF